MTWLVSFALTLAIELPLVRVLLGRTSLRPLLASTLGTCLTHPLLWFVLPRFFTSYLAFLVVGEVAVTLVEGLFLWRIGKVPVRAAMTTSAIVNGASILAGGILRTAGVL